MAYSLTSTNFTFDTTNVVGGVTWSINLNPEANLRFGGTAKAKIEFTVLDWNDDIFWDKIVDPIVFSDGVTPFTLYDGTPVGIYQRSQSIDIIGEEFEYREAANAANLNNASALVGYFTVESVERVDSTKVKLTAYDRMSKFEESADAWLASVTFPKTTTQLLASLCSQLGIAYSNYDAVNTSYSIPAGFSATGVTYRDVLSWLCEVRGQFANISNSGSLILDWYDDASASYDATKTMGTKVSEFDINPYKSIQIRATESDIGITRGSGAPKYIITGNPLFYNNSQSKIQTAADALLPKINTNGFGYTPASFSYWDSTSYRTKRYGRGIILKTSHNPTDGYHVWVMSETINGNKHTIECVGNPYTVNSRSASTQIKQLQGKTAELSYDVNGLKSVVGDSTKGLVSTVEQTAEAITLRVEKSDIANALNTVKQVDASGTRIKIAQDKIDIDGLVKFNDLSKKGSTIINGGNITTGSIDASYIKAGTMKADRISGGKLDFEGMTVKNLKADMLDGGTINAENINVTNLRADHIQENTGTIPSAAVPNLSASILTSGTLSTSRLDAGATSNYLSDNGSLLKKNGTFSGMVQWSGGGGMYQDSNTNRVTIKGGGYPIVFTGNSMILSLGGGGITVWGRPTFNYGIQGPLTVNGSFSVTGSKNALVDTEHYGKRLINAYETAEVYFGDIGEGEVKNGRCEVIIESIFAETVNTEKPYQVFLTPYGRGQIWVSERLPDKFIIEGDDIKFGYEIKAKRRGFEEVRLEEYIEKTDKELKESETNA